MIIDLSGKRAIVTGSTSGIGFAIVRGLANAGAAVLINGRSRDKVKAAQRRLEKEVPGCSVDGVAADLATAAGVADFLRHAGEADILVNNLGIFEPKPFEAITDADWHRFFDTNVMSGVRLSRHYLPTMLARGWGRLVFISSESALNIPVEMIHYGMTKTAQLAIARGLAESVAGTGVTVNAVVPGPTRSEGVADFFGKLAKGAGGVGRRDGGAVHRPQSPDLAAAPAGDAGGGRQHGRLCLLAAGLGHHRRRAARRRRRGTRDCVNTRASLAIGGIRDRLPRQPCSWEPCGASVQG